MRKKQILRRCLVMLFAAAVLCVTTVCAGAATDAGRCGAKLYWSYDADTGTLAFTGTGAMFSYATQDAPWLTYADEIRTVTFESGITGISDRAFYGCKGLQNISVPATVTSIGTSAFENCVSLRQLPIQGGNVTLGSRAFANCKGLESIAIAEGVATIGSGAFQGCDGAKTLSVPASVSEIAPGVFRGCTALEQITVDAANETFTANGNCLIAGDGTLLLGSAACQIPADGTVSAIAADAFCGLTALTEVVIPDSVKSIGEYAFLGCTGLTRVQLGSGLQSIGVGAFQGCSALTQLAMPDTVTSIGACAFSGCTGLRQVNFPLGLESLGSWAFANTAITQASLGDAVSSIGINPFRGCTQLTSIAVNYRNRVYKAVGNCLIGSSEKNLISGCSTSQIPANQVLTIDRDAFRGVSPAQLTVPDSVTSVSAYAFAQSPLQSIHLGAGLTKIADNPFADCQDLTQVTVSADNPVYTVSGNCLLEAATLVAGFRDAQIPATVTRIGNEAFYGSRITELVLPEGVTEIGKRAFFGCTKLITADLPQSLAHISERAFEGSTLKYLSLGELPQIDSYAFLDCYGLKTVYTPQAGILQPGSTEKGYIAYYADLLTSVEPSAVKHYKGAQLQSVYTDFSSALAAYSDGWLQLTADTQIHTVLTKDLYIDLNGHDLSGVLDTAGHAVYGMDTTTDKYTCESTGIFSCHAPDGSPVIPLRYFRSNVTGAYKRYMAILEETGYSFHRFYVSLTHCSMNLSDLSVGYKALICADEKVIAQLDPEEAFGYEVWLQDCVPVNRYKTAEQVVSWKPVTLRIINFQVQEYGETPLYAAVHLKLADGTVIDGGSHNTTMRYIVEHVNDHVSEYSQSQLLGIVELIETYPVMKHWKVDNIIAAVQE